MIEKVLMMGLAVLAAGRVDVTSTAGVIAAPHTQIVVECA